jgi:hypothetical protein
MAGVYTDKRLNLSKLGKACGRGQVVSRYVTYSVPDGKPVSARLVSNLGTLPGS